MNGYVKLVVSLLTGLMFYTILTIGVFYKWWLPDVLLTAIYGGMSTTGFAGAVHYGAKYLSYTSPGVGAGGVETVVPATVPAPENPVQSVPVAPVP